MPSQFRSLIWPGLLLLLVAYPIFGHLGAIPIQLWDEARPATQALEMLHGHNWLTPTFNGAPDMVYTKPPFMIWMQVLCLKLFGISEFATRLPSALAALGTCILVYLPFARKKDPLGGLIAATVLITAPGYVTLHAIRTGDYDSLLTFFTTGFIVCWYLYFDEYKPRYITLTFIFLTLAALTKGVQGLIFSPALIIYAIYKGDARLLKYKQLYIGISFFVAFVLSYYLLREYYNPGYIHAVLDVEVMARYNTPLDGHKGGPWYYYSVLVKYFFQYWYIMVIPGWIAGLFSREQWMRDISIACVYFGLLYLAVITNAQTKLFWYLTPVYPVLAISVAVLLTTVCRVLAGLDVRHIMTHNVLPCVFLIFVFFQPYANIISIVRTDYTGTDREPSRKSMYYFLKDLLHKPDHSLDGAVFLNDGFNWDAGWYFKAFDLLHRPIGQVSRSGLAPGQLVVAYLPESEKYIEDNFQSRIVMQWNNISMYELIAKK